MFIETFFCFVVLLIKETPLSVMVNLTECVSLNDILNSLQSFYVNDTVSLIYIVPLLYTI